MMYDLLIPLSSGSVAVGALAFAVHSSHRLRRQYKIRRIEGIEHVFLDHLASLDARVDDLRFAFRRRLESLDDAAAVGTDVASDEFSYLLARPREQVLEQLLVGLKIPEIRDATIGLKTHSPMAYVADVRHQLEEGLSKWNKLSSSEQSGRAWLIPYDIPAEPGIAIVD